MSDTCTWRTPALAVPGSAGEDRVMSLKT